MRTKKRRTADRLEAVGERVTHVRLVIEIRAVAEQHVLVNADPLKLFLR